MGSKRFMVVNISDFRDQGIAGRIQPLVNCIGSVETKKEANEIIGQHNGQCLIIDFEGNEKGRIINLADKFAE